MQRESRLRRQATSLFASQPHQTSSTAPNAEIFQQQQHYIYPTPTSLESRTSPLKTPLVEVFPLVGSTFEQPPSGTLIDDAGERRRGRERSGGEGKDEETVCCLPLIVGPTPRQTGAVAIPRRTKRKRRIDSAGMERVRGETRQSSLHAEVYRHFATASRADLRDSSSIETPQETCHLATSTPSNRLLLSALTESFLLRRLIAQLQHCRLDGAEAFSCIRVSASTQHELANSLFTVFFPICHKYGASVDTAVLAYGIVCKYSLRCAPRLSSTRAQLYVAALVIAFKYNEEEDPNITDFSRMIAKCPGAPLPFASKMLPTPHAVTRMEQKIMRTIDWRIGDIATPLVLTLALLDCLPGAWCVSAKRRIIGMTSVVLEGLLGAPDASTRFPFSMPRWTIFALGQVLSILSRQRYAGSVDQYVRLLHRIIYPDVRLETDKRPPWLEALSKYATENIMSRSASAPGS